jgi:hypothetical protein
LASTVMIRFTVLDRDATKPVCATVLEWPH